MTGDSQKNKWPELAHSTIVTADKEVSDGDENDRTQRCCSQRVEETAAKNSELGEDPATEVGTNQAKYDVRDAAESAAACDFAGEPSCNQAEKKPRDDPVCFEPDSNGSLCRHLIGEHEAS